MNKTGPFAGPKKWLQLCLLFQYPLLILKPTCSGQGVRRPGSGIFAARVSPLSLSFLIWRMRTIALFARVVVKLQGAKVLCKLYSAGGPTPPPTLGWALNLSGLLWVPGLPLSLQGVDDLISPDALSTVREMDVANFRRVPRMPIYGTAQPSAKVTTQWACLWGGRGRS